MYTVQEIHDHPPGGPLFLIQLGTDFATREWAEEYELEAADLGNMLDSRYDDLQKGRAKPNPGDEVEAYFREKSAAVRR